MPKGSPGKGWRRIGIAVSVLWFIGFALFVFVTEKQRITDFYSSPPHCQLMLRLGYELLGEKPPDKEKADEWNRRSDQLAAEYTECQEVGRELHRQLYDDLITKGIAIILAVDLVTILFGWLVVWGIVSVVRWARRGFAE